MIYDLAFHEIISQEGLILSCLCHFTIILNFRLYICICGLINIPYETFDTLQECEQIEKIEVENDPS